MHRRPPHTAQKILAVASALALGVAVSGCGNNDKTDLANGKTKFIEKCGGCHTLARANTSGTAGPDLDDSFRRARIDGMDNTIQGVVEKQIKWPTQNLYPQSLVMPANLVTGQDVEDVAAYIAQAAAAEGTDSGALAEVGGGTDGKGLFKTNCGSCHTLSDAGTSGAAGPNLDDSKLALAAVVKQITKGGGGMPAFGGTLSKQQVELIAKYITDARGK
jgi:cbb3-type cytochrome c oxidase subunit III